MWGLSVEDCLALWGNFYSSNTLVQTYFAVTVGFCDGYPWAKTEQHRLCLLLRLAQVFLEDAQSFG